MGYSDLRNVKAELAAIEMTTLGVLSEVVDSKYLFVVVPSTIVVAFTGTVHGPAGVRMNTADPLQAFLLGFQLDDLQVFGLVVTAWLVIRSQRMAGWKPQDF